MAKVLLTGGTGFVASHILEELLNQRYSVIVTVRSAVKGQRILDAYHDLPRHRLSFVVVEDIAKAGAFDDAVKTEPPLDCIVHTASPYHFNVQNAIKDFHEPAVNGTTEILKAAASFAPTVRRVVFTMSFANIVNPIKHEKVYDERFWASVSEEDSVSPAQAYRASKIFAEKAARDFVEREKPLFDLVTMHPPLIFGPPSRFVDSLDALNTSNDRVRRMLSGELKAIGLPPTVVYIFADVRDVALAHIRALQVDEAGGQRFLITGGYFSNKQIADIIRKLYPELARENLPPSKETNDDTPLDVYGYNNRKSREVLGLRYRTLDECIQDTVASMIALGAGVYR